MEEAGSFQALFSDRVLWILIVMILLLTAMAFFFAAFTFLLRIRNEWEARIWARQKRIWEPLLLEVLVDPERLPALWEKVGKKDHLQFVEYVLRYAQRLGGAERDVLQKAAAPYLPEILPRLQHGQMGVRARAVQALGTLGLPEFEGEVRAAIEDPSPFVAAIAARLLAQELGAKMALDLFRNLDRFRSFRIWYLVDMVVGLGPGAVPAIRSTMADASMPARTRAVAAHALSVLRDLGSGDLAAALMATESDPEFLASLLRLLAQVGTPDHSPAVRMQLDSEEFFVRAAATRTLSELGAKEDLPLLVEKLGDPSSWVRVAAARGVFRLGGRAALAALNRPDDPAGPVFRQVLAEEGQ